MTRIKAPSNFTNIILALIVALPLIITSVGTLNQNRKSEEILRKTDEIHTLTNSNLSRISTELKVANEKIAGLEKQLALLTERNTKGTK